MTNETVHVFETFLDVARTQGRGVAVVDYERSVTYQDLEIRAARVAELLIARGVCLGSTVGIWGERSIELIIGLLAVMQAGGSCLPLDASYPPERLRFMLGDCNVSLVLVTDNVITTEPLGTIDAVRMTSIGHHALDAKQEFPRPQLDADAYALYTSGSTGRPKGVAMQHRGLAALIAWQIEQSSTIQGATLQFAPISFDVCFQEIFSTLCAGTTLVLIRDADRRDTRKLVSIMARFSVARLFLPTSALHHLATAMVAGDSLPALRQVIVAGEQLIITPAIRQWFSSMPLCSLHNQYGPTETHVVSSFLLAGKPSHWPAVPPIGKLIPHALGLIVNQNGDLSAEGDIGELLVGGVCVARGYIGQPRLTSERFVSVVPYASVFYRTGDLVRRELDVLEFCGRVDDQVKMRGYRIEPAEIEAILMTHSEVASCVVSVDRSIPETPFLTGYVVPSAVSKPALLGGCPIVRTINPPWQDFLLSRLPEYMVPRVWVVVDDLPETVSGKIDRKSLPAIPTDRPIQSMAHTRVRDGVEAELVSIWKELLNLADIGIDDRFFDLGGTSLHLVRMQAQIYDRIKVRCSVVEIISNPTVRSLASFVSGIDDLPKGSPSPVAHSCFPATPGSRNAAAIAIVGMSCRFPGANSPEQFWQNLRAGVDSVRRSTQSVDLEDQEKFVFASGSLMNVEAFDSNYFGYSEHDADQLDPQHRLFLECSVEALEDASVDPDTSGLKIGVFGGCAPSTYLMNNLMADASSDADRTLVLSSLGLQLLLASDKDFLVSRVSYKLNLTGPSVNVNSACATSLFAVHLACSSIRNGECDLALAGAACILTPQVGGHAYEPGMVFSPDGFCRAFSSDANGAVFGDGVGIVALRRLDDAVAAGDRIYAVIEGSAINNDGSMKMGMAAPSVAGQIDVISQAQVNASVAPRDVSYVEGHGTATKIGDSIELAALDAVFGQSDAPWCALGSVKTNLGHLGWASGMAGLIKTSLAIFHKELPPSLHCITPNDLISAPRSAFRINDKLTPWVASGRRVAGISAFGLGGGNAHLILAEPGRNCAKAPLAVTPLIFPLSAATPEGLRLVARRYKEHVLQNLDVNLLEVSATLRTGRRHLPFRKAVVARDRRQLVSLLDAVETDHEVARSPYRETVRNKVVALFTGQGMEYCGMGGGLYDTWQPFRSLVDSADPIFLQHFGVRASAMFRDVTQFEQISRVQPLVFVLQMGLVELFRSWGLKFDVVLGHSLGEFAAACTADVFSFCDGLELVIERGRLLESLPSDSGMLCVFSSAAEVELTIASIGASIEIAACNSPANTIASGRKSDLKRLADEATKNGLRSRMLNVSRAGHSAQMDSILDEFETAVRKISLCVPKLEIISNLYGKAVREEICQPKYWRRHLRETVRFVEGVRAASQIGETHFFEIGPGSGLLSLAAGTVPGHSGKFVSSLQKNFDENDCVLRAAACLFEVGQSLNWKSLGTAGAPRASLPTYPFESVKHWIAKTPNRTAPTEYGESEQWSKFAYSISWREHLIIDRVTDNSTAPVWVLLTESLNQASGLVDALKRRGGQCLLFTLDREALAFSQMTTSTVDADWKGAVGELSEYLRSVIPSGGFRTVVLCNGSARPNGEISIDNLARACSMPLAILQALTIVCSDLSELWLVTFGAQAFQQPFAKVALCQSPLLGLKRTFNLEYPLIRTISLDIQASDLLTHDVAALALSSELFEDELIAVAGKLFVPRLVTLNLRDTRPRLNESSAYLITGGFSGVAIQSAKVLVHCGAKNLVLVGRSGVNPVAAAAIAEFERQGVHVERNFTDITDGLQVRRLIDDILLRGPLAGILHCAGVIDDSLVSQQSWRRFSNTLQPKALAAWHLHEASFERKAKLDFFVFFSSSSSLLGDDGQSNHAAACAFLDEFAIYRRAMGLAATSINWGAWKEDGFFARRPDLLGQIISRGDGALSRGQATAALMAALTDDSPRIAILPTEWKKFVNNSKRHVAPFLSDLVQPRNAPVVVQQAAVEVAASETTARLEITKEHLKRILQSILGGNGLEEFAANSNISWANRGVDSLQTIRMVNAIQREFQCRIASRTVQERLGLTELAEHLLLHVFTEEWRSKVLASDLVRNDARNASSVRDFALSTQQNRWLSLITNANYGHRAVPIVFHTALRADVFSNALRRVVDRHVLLRYVYEPHGITLLSTDDVMSRQSPLFVDLKHVESTAARLAMREQVARCLRSLPSPTKDVSWRICCVDWATDKFIVLLGLQHIDFDGTSLSIFVDELRENYLSLVSNNEFANLPEAVQYGDYVAAQRSYVENAMANDKAFFEGLLMQVSATTSLPNHAGYAVTTAQQSARYTPSFGLADWPDIVALANVLKVSPFSIVLASYARMLHEVLGVSPVVIGIVVSGRVDDRFARTIGPFTSHVPVPVGDILCDDFSLVQSCHRVASAVATRGMFPSSALTELIPAFANFPSDTYFSDVGINFLNYQREGAVPDLLVDVLEILGPINTPPFDSSDFSVLRRIPGLHLVADVSDGVLRGNYWYHSARFDQDQVAAWAACQKRCLQKILDSAQQLR